MDFATIFDIGKRMACHPGDYVGVMQRHKLTLLSSRQESDAIYSFFFSATQPLDWSPGQHAIFYLPATLTSDRKRVYSIASTPAENHIHISTVIKDNPSQYKSALRALQPGDEITMYGPIGEFHTRHQSQHIIGVAGGIGITPFRSLIKDVVTTKSTNVTIELLYGCQSGVRTFESELMEWSKEPNISVRIIEGVTELQTALLQSVELHRNNADYYLSGSPGMITALQLLLRKEKIKTIINDPFKGY